MGRSRQRTLNYASRMPINRSNFDCWRDFQWWSSRTRVQEDADRPNVPAERNHATSNKERYDEKPITPHRVAS